MLFSKDWEEFPKTYNWKEAIVFIKEKNILENDKKMLLNILINEGNTVEDEALTVAVLENCFENEECSKEEIIGKFGINVADAVQEITRKKEEDYEQYIDRIFNSNKFKYIRKIVVANQINELRLKKHTKDMMMKVKKLLQYEEYTNRELMKKLKEEVGNDVCGG